jgi:hypothetical protein
MATQGVFECAQLLRENDAEGWVSRNISAEFQEFTRNRSISEVVTELIPLVNETANSGRS